MKKLLLLSLLIAVGCKGKDGSMGSSGSQGPQGTPGLNAPQEVTLEGAVTSDDFTITDAQISLASNVSVFLTDGTKLTESPYFLPTLGVNTYYLFDPAAGTIRFYNAQSAGATGYIVVMFL